MLSIVVIGTYRVGRGRSGSLYDLLMIFLRPHNWDIFVYRSGFGRVLLKSAALLADYKKRRTFASVICDGSIPSLNPRKAAIAIPKGGFIGIQKSLRIRDSRYASVGVFATIFPGEYATICNDTLRIGLV